MEDSKSVQPSLNPRTNLLEKAESDQLELTQPFPCKGHTESFSFLILCGGFRKIAL